MTRPGRDGNKQILAFNPCEVNAIRAAVAVLVTEPQLEAIIYNCSAKLAEQVEISLSIMFRSSIIKRPRKKNV